MSIYIFPEKFGKLEITPSSIEVDFKTLVQYPNSSTFDVDVLLITQGTYYVHQFKGLPYVGQLTNSEVEKVALNGLNEFIKR